MGEPQLDRLCPVLLLQVAGDACRRGAAANASAAVRRFDGDHEAPQRGTPSGLFEKAASDRPRPSPSEGKMGEH